MDTGKAIVIGGVVVIGGVLLYKLTRGATPALTTASSAKPPQSSQPNVLQTAQKAASAYTGIPLEAIGKTAQAAPTWAKVLYTPLLYESAAQSFIEHPLDTTKSAWNKAKNVGKATLSTITFGLL